MTESIIGPPGVKVCITEVGYVSKGKDDADVYTDEHGHEWLFPTCGVIPLDGNRTVIKIKTGEYVIVQHP